MSNTTKVHLFFSQVAGLPTAGGLVEGLTVVNTPEVPTVEADLCNREGFLLKVNPDWFDSSTEDVVMHSLEDAVSAALP